MEDAFLQHFLTFVRGPAANGGGRGVKDVPVGLKAEFAPSRVFKTFIVVNGERQ